MMIFAVDLGRVRTGLAVSDQTGFIAVPVGTITQRDIKKLVLQVAEEAKLKKAGLIIVGYPRNMDGSCGESAHMAEDFALELEKQSGIPVKLWDERMTTLSAIGILNESNTRGKKRKAVIDTVAATIILQDYLDSIRDKK
ncbi:MAG: Holliday junction resolvase RuvX [Oscillospiraceae bacterium]|nr:Holliday junction resolvase RuvX [Oscillospiraceae bacterium]MDD3832583.1 Holliday junction resolvase RuvX [Oscillospiraceae bacterium]